jgi:hypothetical protein
LFVSLSNSLTIAENDVPISMRGDLGFFFIHGVYTRMDITVKRIWICGAHVPHSRGGLLKVD